MKKPGAQKAPDGWTSCCNLNLRPLAAPIKSAVLSTILYLSIMTGFTACAQNSDEAPPTPSAPITAKGFGGWDKAYELINDSLRVVIAPQAGRLVHLSYIHKPNLLRFDESLAGKVPSPDEGEWFNHGGDWLWPTSQTNWTQLTGSDWPPPRLLEGRPWEGRGWSQSDGSFVVELRQTYEAPLNITVIRKFSLPVKGAELVIEQSIERTAPSDIPVTLWNISQVSKADAALLAIDPSRKDKGIRPMKFGDPSPDSLTFCESYVVYKPEEESNRKIASSARPSWIAALVKDTLILQVMTEPNPDAPHPDEDSTLQMYSQPGEYIEIEPLGEERLLAPGEILKNKIRIGLLKVQNIEDICDWGSRIQSFLDTPSTP